MKITVYDLGRNSEIELVFFYIKVSAGHIADCNTVTWSGRFMHISKAIRSVNTFYIAWQQSRHPRLWCFIKETINVRWSTLRFLRTLFREFNKKSLPKRFFWRLLNRISFFCRRNTSSISIEDLSKFCINKCLD